MTDIKFFQEIPIESLSFLEKINKLSDFDLLPATQQVTKIGKKINMGYVCYYLKILKITGEWDKCDLELKEKWKNKLLHYQRDKFEIYDNYFLDPELVRYFNSKFTKYNLKNLVKQTANSLLNKKFETKQKHIFKTINADNKQTISTLNEIGFSDHSKQEIMLDNFVNTHSYLDSYDWSKPWDAGAQFSSIALYNNLFSLGLENELSNYIEKKLNKETGSYFDRRPNHNRQIINGAMKVITGLDWLGHNIHEPENLLDFCIENKPEFEGCDLVDYVYVLYKCSNQVNYRKEEVSKVVLEILDYLNLLYHKEAKGFSYFVNKSQTHYYGIEITKGANTPDLHGTLLSNWAIAMILEILEKNKFSYKTIRP